MVPPSLRTGVLSWPREARIAIVVPAGTKIPAAARPLSSGPSPAIQTCRLGISAAAVGGRVLSAYLYQTTPRDPLIVGVVAVTFLGAAALACLAPARRATTVDPLIALRTE